jgi:hypothetical protein
MANPSCKQRLPLTIQFWQMLSAASFRGCGEGRMTVKKSRRHPLNRHFRESGHLGFKPRNAPLDSRLCV